MKLSCPAAFVKSLRGAFFQSVGGMGVMLAAFGAGPLVAGEGGGRPPVIQVRVADRQVPVIEHWVNGRLNCTYASLVLPGSAEVEVEVPGGVRHWTLSPRQASGAGRMKDGRLKFDLLTSRHLVATVNGLRLLLLADPPEEELPAEVKMLDVTAAPYGVGRSGSQDVTALLQRACDDAGMLGGETIVVLPPGLYKTTGISLRSRTQLYLAPGAVLQASEEIESYPQYTGEAGKTSTMALVKVDGVEHVRIFGRGTLDVRGQALAGQARGRDASRLLASCVVVGRSRCVSVEGVVCKESSAAALTFSHSQYVAVRRVKVINDMEGADMVGGMLLSAVENALVEDCLVHTTEDAYGVAGAEGAPTSQVVMRRLVALSRARALRCGPTAHERLARVRFEEIDIVESRDAIELMHGTGSGDWSDITFREVRVERCGRNGISILLQGGGSLRNVRFEEVRFAARRPGFIRGGGPGLPVQSVTFAGLMIEGHPATDAASAGIRLGPHVSEIRFER